MSDQSESRHLDITLSPEEVERVADGLKQPTRQVERLRELGFWRARLGKCGQAVLEREHYRAVCAGAVAPGSTPPDTERPRVLD